ncbi:hypothetical protein C8R34_12519 [Nitrosomonas sp. Nm84]|uniref:hypothetical protein n=1 Tax=Nitrosomonas sp. Nm84 TaxID=200124 RepID=UPI000D756EF5|nr:hypothetical protein [Nitrosomonas sp. Nm84]PXW83881.1 hypothetical protein C8R34_12519 [Nitrosomonas sp. Nm84]
MTDTILNGNETKSLATQIKDAELQALQRQRMVIIRADTLIQKTQQQMTAPASLLLAGGIGFVLGELTKRKSFKPNDASEKPQAAETTDITKTLMSALNQLATINALYTTFRDSMKQTES